ncbi:MAG: FliI/YscN family ATPase [Pseudomonadota bacterium]
MQHNRFSLLKAEIAATRPSRAVGRIVRAGAGTVEARGLAEAAALGDGVRIDAVRGPVGGEIVEITDQGVRILPEGSGDGLRIGDPIVHQGPPTIAPHEGWIGRIVDGNGQPIDGRPLPRGALERPLRAPPPDAIRRRAMGARLATGLAIFDTLLPVVRGQRLGVFSGSGVGKSTLLADLGCGLEADVAVIALVGERGREVKTFVERSLGKAGLARAVVVAATSDRPPLQRRRAMWTAMAVAEHFRDAGRHVLFLADSVTRFAEAHREIALAAGEAPALGGYPPSVAREIMALAERAGPGDEASGGDITAILSVLVAGADMDGPVADILRGVLDGHVVLDRAIAERGRFPAVDVLRSVSRSLPECASLEENTLVALARKRLGAYDQAELMVQSGLYAAGSDAEVDAAVSVWPKLDAFVAERSPKGPAGAFARLAAILGQPTKG